MKPTRRALFATAAAALAWPAAARANPSMLKTFDYARPIFAHPHPFATARVVIQVSEDDPVRWGMALSNAQNMLKLMGPDRAQIVIVAYGPGLKMLLAASPVADRIAALDAEGVEFDACHNTMMALARAFGHMPKLVKQAVIVPAGVVRVAQLEAHGFSYIKP